MSCPLAAAYAIVRLFAPADGEPAAVTRSDSTAEAMVLDEMRAFYRDLEDRSWSPLLDHFLPSKVTARWAPPRGSNAWAHLEAPAPLADGVVRARARCARRAAVVVVGDWARVRTRRCDAAVDEAWLLRVSGRWKIVYLDLAPSPHVTRAEP